MTANHRPLEEGDIELIDRIRATPCLYDTKDPDFRLVYKKEQQWQAIADGLSMSHWEARKRWTVLRDRYARELKQLLLHPDSMEYGKNEFFHRMDFLRSFVKKRSVRKKCYNSQGEDMDDEDRPRPIKIFKVDCNVNNFESNDNQPQQQLLQHHRKTYIIDDSQDSSAGKYSYVEQSSQETNEQAQHDNVQHISEHCAEQEYHDYVEDMEFKNRMQKYRCKLKKNCEKFKNHLNKERERDKKRRNTQKTRMDNEALNEIRRRNRERQRLHRENKRKCMKLRNVFSPSEIGSDLSVTLLSAGKEKDTSTAYDGVEVDHVTHPHDVSNHSLMAASVSSNIEVSVKPETNKVPSNFSITTIEEDQLSNLPHLQQRPHLQTTCTHPATRSEQNDSEEYFSKTIASYLKQLSRRYKIKAKVEMMQILEKYIELEEIKENSNIKQF